MFLSLRRLPFPNSRNWFNRLYSKWRRYRTVMVILVKIAQKKIAEAHCGGVDTERGLTSESGLTIFSLSPSLFILSVLFIFKAL